MRRFIESVIHFLPCNKNWKGKTSDEPEYVYFKASLTKYIMLVGLKSKLHI